MSIFLGGNEFSGMYLGSNEISEMYLGSNLIYSSSSVWPYETLRFSFDNGVKWTDYGRPVEVAMYLFTGLMITHVELPDSIQLIDDYAFWGNYLTHIEFPKTLKAIGYESFGMNPFTYIEFPKTLEFIGDSAFGDNILLDEVRISSQTSYTKTGKYATFPSHTRIITY